MTTVNYSRNVDIDSMNELDAELAAGECIGFDESELLDPNARDLFDLFTAPAPSSDVR